MNSKGLRVVFLVIFGLFAAWGVVGVVQRLLLGHHLTNYGSYVPWGLWVSAYIYFVGLSAGSFLLSSMIYVFRIQGLSRIGRPALLISVVTLLMALICILFDLGHWERFYEVFTRPRFSSLMAWMVWLYTAYFLLILAELWLEMRIDLAMLARSSDRLAPFYQLLTLGWRCPEDDRGIELARARGSRQLQILAAFGLPLAVTFHGGVGALFAGLLARPYWHSALYPILFLTGALVSGGGLLLAVVAINPFGRIKVNSETIRRLSQYVLALLILDLLIEWTEISIHSWYRIGPEYELLKSILLGQYWWIFWVVHLALGVLIPLVLLVRRPTTTWKAGLAGMLIAVTFLAVRLTIVVPGQITPQLSGLERSYMDDRLLFSYIPSIFEWSVVAFVVAMGFGLFYVGCRYLPVSEVRTPTATR